MSGGRSIARHRLLPLLLVPACLLAVPLADADGAEDPARSTMKTVTQAWTKEKAGDVVSSMLAKGRLTLVLRTPRISGSFPKAQAERTLDAYFRKVSDLSLKDVTPRTHRDGPGYRTRIYEYRYQPRGRDPVTALLVVTLRQDARAGWHLVSIEERPKRSTRG